MKLAVWMTVAAGAFAAGAAGVDELSFSLKVAAADGSGARYVRAAEMQHRAATAEGIEWKGHPELGADFTVKAVMRATAEGVREVTVGYSGNRSELRVEELVFPEWTVSRSRGARIFYPNYVGVERSPRWNEFKPGELVNGVGPCFMGLHYVAAFDDVYGSFMLDQRGDARFYATRLEICNGEQPETLTLKSIHYLPLDEATRSAFTVPYPITLTKFVGGWFEAAKIYRDWVHAQDWYRRAAARDFSEMRGIALWMWNRGPSAVTVPPAVKFMEDTKLKVALDWYWWHGIPYDTSYPFFWPPREPVAEFRAGVEAIHAAGGYVQPYTNGMLWDLDDARWAEGGAGSAIVNADGQPKASMFNPYTRQRQAWCCGEAPAFQTRMRQLERQLASTGMDGVYMDMIASAAFGPCYNSQHQHAPGGGRFMVDGYRRYVNQVRSDNPGLLLSSEEHSEAYFDIFDSLIYVYPSYERFEGGCEPEYRRVPATLAVYHGAVPAFGSFATVDDRPPWDEKWGASPFTNDVEQLERRYPDQFAVEFARGVVWGLQPTVHKFLLEHATSPRFAGEYQFFKDTARFYFDNRDWLFDGEMQAEGVMHCVRQPVKFLRRSCYTKPEAVKTAVEPGLDTIFHSVWKAKDGRRAAVLGNWSRQAQKYELIVGDRCWRGTLAARSWRRLDLNEGGEPTLLVVGERQQGQPIAPAPFPDRLSAYVWRNWFLVAHARLAQTVGCTEAELEAVAAEMGLPRKVAILPEWRRKGYITIVRENWHLLDYPQLLELLDMTRAELDFSLKEDDFLWNKLGKVKPHCGRLEYDPEAVAATRAARLELGRLVRVEKLDDFTEEPRFAFIRDLAAVAPSLPAPASKRGDSPFGMRLIFSYFADYGDPLIDPAIGSYPEGLLQKLAQAGVNAVWLHTVLSTLAKDPAYPEFGERSEERLVHLQTLVDRAAKYGIRVYLYMNEPRAQPPEFFEKSAARRALRGAVQPGNGVYARCTADPETRRWLKDSLRQVFSTVRGLGGIFTITMSENLTHCASKWNVASCPRCRHRQVSELIVETNRAMVEGMLEGDPNAEALIWNWSWPHADEAAVLKGLPKRNCRVMAVSEGRMPICRGGVQVETHDYSISCVGPSARAQEFWDGARAVGLSPAAKVQANTTWEIASVPYLPVMDLVAEHASKLVRAGVDGVMLSWSLGCAPAPNLKVFDAIGRDGDSEAVLNRLAAEYYGAEAVPAVRKAWTAFSEGFRNFPFSLNVLYYGPQQWGPVNPLYVQPTGWVSTMVGMPYDDVASWCDVYPPAVWTKLMQQVADGFEQGCEVWQRAVAAMKDARQRAVAQREYGLFRAAGLHYASCADQVRLYEARNRGDRAAMAAAVRRELKRAQEELQLVRADSRIGYESSNHYFFTAQNLREKILACRQFLESCD